MGVSHVSGSFLWNPWNVVFNDWPDSFTFRMVSLSFSSFSSLSCFCPSQEFVCFIGFIVLQNSKIYESNSILS